MDNLDIAAQNLAKAIKQAETGEGNTYSVKGQSGEFGAYQFMPATYRVYAEKYLKDRNAVPNIENQNKIAYLFVKEKKDAGYTPAQIASMWNAGEGRPNAYKENFRGVNKAGVKFDTPAYVKKVSANYEMLSSQGQPQEKAPEVPREKTIDEQKQELIRQGQPVSTRDDRVDPTFIGSMIRDTIRPVARVSSSIIDLLNLNTGKPDGQTPYSGSYLGEIKPIAQEGTLGQRAKDVAGTALELATLMPMGKAIGGAAKILKTGAKTAKRLATPAVQGAIGAGMFGTGRALQENESIPTAVMEGAIAAPFGFVGGAALSKLAMLKNVIKPTTGAMEEAIKRTSKRFRTSLNLTPKQTYNESFLKEVTGRDVHDTLGKYGFDPKDKGVLAKIEKAIKPYQEAANLYRQTERNFFTIDDAWKATEDEARRTIKSVASRDKVLKEMKNEIAAILKDNPNDFVRSKNGIRVNIKIIDRLRQLANSWARYDKAFDSEDSFRKVARILGENIRKVIDKEGSIPGYNAVNEELGNLLHAKKTLQSLINSGKDVYKTKESISKWALRRVVGGIAGYQMGGLPGIIAADLGSGPVERILSNASLKNKVDKLIASHANEEITYELANKLSNQIRRLLKIQKTQGLLPEVTSKKSYSQYLIRQQNKRGAVEVGAYKKPVPVMQDMVRRIENDMQQNLTILKNTKFLEQPTPRKILPLGYTSATTDTTANTVGGMRQRIPIQSKEVSPKPLVREAKVITNPKQKVIFDSKQGKEKILDTGKLTIRQEEISALKDQKAFLEEQLRSHPGKLAKKFMSRREGEFLDFSNPRNQTNPKKRLLLEQRNKNVMNKLESAFDGTKYAGGFDKEDIIRESIDDVNKLQKQLREVNEMLRLKQLEEEF